ncbi:DNA polymerase III subunit epsilon [Photorhabdus laumondii subsp. laumondii]|uniref:DNA polymerase III subunit epsilon n=2 Tax=Photorhabdus laumondii subsp. laumondii TaxID=141679 RepID=Q7N806_PHOLL|nr:MULTISPECIES: DNA polymerase III subunit epsilon [Photorhabdus]AWK40869.1 DNA polymerase III subunit epsilon [Photorhabdus laumondii subsp. laumondii]AXG41676.1 DNA polymerase III subunit epsilon [Photorhabdus laumondii subsp. laumondii]AXG46205.1 DNA polymerase III subunit epsilon [Photorhabdus laumondii subsp. laumondii]MCC8386283.1 DNA polymerase III subunit epsilon [Photorhabdus laumondii]MCC8390596.1 DNA polymerase III subunit epsilon [Photorhabdus laumondii]
MSTAITRQVVLDTETTGMNKLGVHYEGHKIIEIGAVEVINRRLTGRHFHVYIQPDRLVDPEAFEVHGISDEFLQDKPLFADIADEFIEFIRGAELIIHNAPFDIGFIDYEFGKLNRDIPPTADFCKITDSLQLARGLFPGKRNNLDALCDRYDIDNSKRTLHGALLDAEILSDVYLIMTGGQTSLAFSMEGEIASGANVSEIQRITRPQMALKVIYATDEELAAHESRLDLVEKKGGSCLWRMNLGQS